jgi:hypothetical protein
MLNTIVELLATVPAVQCIEFHTLKSINRTWFYRIGGSGEGQMSTLGYYLCSLYVGSPLRSTLVSNEFDTVGLWWRTLTEAALEVAFPVLRAA